MTQTKAETITETPETIVKPKWIKTVVIFPDQGAMMGTQSMIQDALTYKGYNEDGVATTKKKDHIHACIDTSQDGIWRLEFYTDKGTIDQKFCNVIVSQIFQQGKGMTFGKEEQARREFANLWL